MTWLSTALYIVPILVLVFWPSRERKSPFDVAMMIPTAVAIDLLSLYLFARVMPLPWVVVLSRPVWVLVWSVFFLRNKKRESIPALSRSDVVMLVVAIGLAVGLSMILSRPTMAWDRGWHVPLVSAFRGQKAPFANVFEPERALHYHTSGDLLAATLVILSGARMHSSLGLSIAHDIMFGLTAASASLMFRQSRGVSVLLALSALLGGPWTLLHFEGMTPDTSYSLFPFLSISYRPHVCIAGLMYVPLVAGLLCAFERPKPIRNELLACAALLAMTDEASFAIWGIGAFMVWIFVPRPFHPKRWHALGVLVGIGVLAIATNILFSGGLSPGGPVSKVAIVAARNPGYFGRPPIPLWTEMGMKTFLIDVAPALLALVILAVPCITQRDRRAFATFGFFTGILIASLYLFTKLEINQSAVEGHRFFALAEVGVALVLGARLHTFGSPTLSIGAALVIGLSSVSTIVWLDRVAPGIAPKLYDPREHEMNCKIENGASVFERTEPTYIPGPQMVVFQGCRAAFEPGQMSLFWGVKADGAVQGRPAFEELDRVMVPRDASLRLFCPVNDPSDPACAYATARGKCTQPGTTLLECRLDAAERADLLAHW